MKNLKSQTLFRVGLACIILILLNVVSIRVFGRLDMTSLGLFTLSDASKELMRSLDDVVTIKAYFTDDLPAPYSNTRRALIDQLNEYRAYSSGNLQFEFISPTGEKGEQDAMQQGILQAQVQVVEKDKFEVKRAYMGMVFLYEDRKEIIPLIQNTSNLEYDISSTIKRLVSRTKKKIGFLTGNGEIPLNEFSRVQEELKKQYDVTTVELSGGQMAPADLAALLVISPKNRVPETVKFQIDQYIMRGGKVAFLFDKVDADLQQRFGRPIEMGMEDMLETYGLRINADLVRDVQCANISVVQQQFGFNIQSQVPYPYLPLASDFSPDNVIVKDLKGVIMFFASSVDTTALASKGLRGEVLMRSSRQSGRQSQFYMLDPLQRFSEADFTERHIPLGIITFGQFKSAFAGKSVPVDTAVGAIAPTTTLEQSSENRIILIGDGDFARDPYLGNRDNLSLFANIVDYLADDAGLITIRSKDVGLPPLNQIADGTKQALKYGNLILPPVLVLVFGLIRWRIRKARKKAMEMH